MATPRPTPKITIKNARPPLKYTPPTIAEFKQSAAGRNGAMTYKEYIKVSEQVYKAKQKNK